MRPLRSSLKTSGRITPDRSAASGGPRRKRRTSQVLTQFCSWKALSQLASLSKRRIVFDVTLKASSPIQYRRPSRTPRNFSRTSWDFRTPSHETSRRMSRSSRGRYCQLLCRRSSRSTRRAMLALQHLFSTNRRCIDLLSTMSTRTPPHQLRSITAICRWRAFQSMNLRVDFRHQSHLRCT